MSGAAHSNYKTDKPKPYTPQYNYKKVNSTNLYLLR